MNKLLKNKGCGSKQVVQDLTEAEESRIKRRKELLLVTITTIRKKSRRPDPSYYGDPLIQDGLDFWLERGEFEWKSAT